MFRWMDARARGADMIVLSVGDAKDREEMRLTYREAASAVRWLLIALGQADERAYNDECDVQGS